MDTGFVRSTQRKRESRAAQMWKAKEAGSHLFQGLRILSKTLDWDREAENEVFYKHMK